MTATVPPPAAPAAVESRWRRITPPALVLGGLAAASLALHLRDPHDSGAWGLCPSAAMGISCPGCGGLRAVNDLTNGDLAAAASSNLLLVVALPFVLVGLGIWAADRWRGTTRTLPHAWRRPLLVGTVGVLLVFTVLRNLPGSWLAP